MQGNARIYTKTFRKRFRDKAKLERMGLHREVDGTFKRTGRSKFSKLERLQARTTAMESKWYAVPDYTRLTQTYLQERVTYAGISRLTMPELLR